MRARAALTALVALALGGGAAATEHQRAPFPTVDASGALLERRALVALANATNWQAWQQPWPLQRWRQEDPCGNGWAGVFCAPNGRVRRLCGPQPLHHLPAQGLSGPLHPALGQLSFLRELRLNQNALRGPIPDSFRRLTRLRALDLSSNSLSGRVPDLEPLAALEKINLASNPLLEGTVSSAVLLRTRTHAFDDTQIMAGSAAEPVVDVAV